MGVFVHNMRCDALNGKPEPVFRILVTLVDQTVAFREHGTSGKAIATANRLIRCTHGSSAKVLNDSSSVIARISMDDMGGYRTQLVAA